MAGPQDLVHGRGYCFRGRLSGEAHPHVRVHGYSHRMPAPRLRAIDARIATAQVMRVNFSFTPVHLEQETRSVPATGRPRGDTSRGPWLCVPVSQRVCPGRAIHGGRPSPSSARYGRRRCRTTAPWYRAGSTFGAGSATHHPASGQRPPPPRRRRSSRRRC